MLQTNLLLLSLIAFDASANFSVIKTSYAENSWHFSYFANYINTTSNFTDEGISSADLGNDRFYNTFQNTLNSRWVIGKNWAAYGEFSFAYVQTQNNEFLQSRTGLRPLVFGVDYFLWKNHTVRLIGDFSLTIPLAQINYDDASANEPLISDEALGVHPRFRLEVPFKKSLLTSSLGLLWRNQELATLLPYSAGIEWKLKRWLIGSEIFGVLPVISDKKNTQDRHKVNIKASGSSLIFNAVNPSYINARIFSGYRLGPRTAIRFGLGQTLTGTNAANATHIFAGFWYGHPGGRTKGEIKNYQRRIRKRRSEQSDRQKKFTPIKEKTYDEETPRERRRRLKKISDELNEYENDSEE